MVARNSNVKLLLREYDLPGRVWFNDITVNPGRKILITRDPPNKGNFKTATNWNYTVDDWYAPVGYIRHYVPQQFSHKDVARIGSIPNCSQPLGPTWDKSAPYNAAVAKLNDKVRGSLDLGIDVAEWRQTVDMPKELAKVFRFVASGAWKRPRSYKDFYQWMANGWLQWQYGWKPLINDVYEVCDQASRDIRKALTEVKARATIPLGGGDVVSRTVNSVPVSYVRDGKGKQSCTLQVTLEMRNVDPGQWSSLNPLSLGWEIIPYSFVVDWFYNVGSFLRGVESALLYGNYFVDGCKSELYVYEGTETLKSPSYFYGPDAGGAYDRIEYAQSRMKRIEFHRARLTSYPLPRMPVVRANLGSYRLASAAALLGQVLKREFAASAKVRGK